MEKAKNDKKLLEEFHKELLSHWATEDNRVLGRVIFSSPIAVGDSPENFTQDIAVIEVDPSKVHSRRPNRYVPKCEELPQLRLSRGPSPTSLGHYWA